MASTPRQSFTQTPVSIHSRRELDLVSEMPGAERWLRSPGCESRGDIAEGPLGSKAFQHMRRNVGWPIVAGPFESERGFKHLSSI